MESINSSVSFDQIYEQADNFLESAGIYVVSPSFREETRRFRELSRVPNCLALRSNKLQKKDLVSQSVNASSNETECESFSKPGILTLLVPKTKNSLLLS